MYRHPVGFGRKGLSQLFEGVFKVRSPEDTRGRRGESADVPEYSIHIARRATTSKGAFTPSVILVSVVQDSVA